MGEKEFIQAELPGKHFLRFCAKEAIIILAAHGQ